MLETSSGFHCKPRTMSLDLERVIGYVEIYVDGEPQHVEADCVAGTFGTREKAMAAAIALCTKLSANHR